MRNGGVSGDVSPRRLLLSVIAFKPRQVLLQQRSMAKNASSEESILNYTVALWLQNKGFSKVLKRFLDAAQIEGDDWKAQALNLNEIFTKYQDLCKDVHEDVIPQNNRENHAVGSAEQNGVVNSVAHEDMESKKKKKQKKGEVTLTDNGRTSQDMEVDGEVKKPFVSGKEDKGRKTADILHHSAKIFELTAQQGRKAADILNHSAKIFEFTAQQLDKSQKEKKKKNKSTLEDKKKKKSKPTSDLSENQNDVEAEVNEEVLKGSLANGFDAKSDSELVVESKDKKKKKKKLKGNHLDASSIESARDLVEEQMKKKDATNSSELPPSGTELTNKSKKRPAEAAEGGADESKKVSKKRKIGSVDENDNQSGIEVTTEEPKSKKTKGLEDGKENPGFSRKQNGNAAEPKKTFQRVKVEEVKFADERLQDNSYWAKHGAEIGYGAKAQEVLGQVRGRDFRHEKTKKKRGSYRGGMIDQQSHSIKFDNSDDE